jgi:plasmid stability protein
MRRRDDIGAGQSMEEEVRDILRNAGREEEASPGGLGTEIASLFARVGLQKDIAELRGPARLELAGDPVQFGTDSPRSLVSLGSSFDRGFGSPQKGHSSRTWPFFWLALNSGTCRCNSVRYHFLHANS